jgi:hypothetical protein
MKIAQQEGWIVNPYSSWSGNSLLSASLPLEHPNLGRFDQQPGNRAGYAMAMISAYMREWRLISQEVWSG